MAYSFDNALADFKDDKINQLANDEYGLRFLKLRSLSRSQHMRTLAENCDLDLSGEPSKNLLKRLFNSDKVTSHLIHKTIDHIFTEERKERKASEKDLVSELYKINSFDWGGLHQNSLEKTIVDQYVKKITSYDDLCENIAWIIHEICKIPVQYINFIRVKVALNFKQSFSKKGDPSTNCCFRNFPG